MQIVFIAALLVLLWLIWYRWSREDSGASTGRTRDYGLVIPLILIAGVPLTSSHREPNPVAMKLTGIESSNRLTVGNDRRRDDLFVPYFPGESGGGAAAEPFVTATADDGLELKATGNGRQAGMDISYTAADGTTCRLQHNTSCDPSGAPVGQANVPWTSEPIQISLIRTEPCQSEEIGCDRREQTRSTERRSFTLALAETGGEQVIRLTLDSPESADGGTCQQPYLTMQARGTDDAAGEGIAASGFLFANLNPQIAAREALQFDPRCVAGTNTTTLPAERADRTSVTLLIKVTRAGVNWPGVTLFALILLFALVTAQAIGNRGRFLTIAEPVVLSLLAIRLLAAMAATYLSPGLSSIPTVAELIGDAIVLLIALRMMLWREMRRDWRFAMLHIGFATTTLLSAEAIAGSANGNYAAALIKVGVLVFLWLCARIGDAIAARQKSAVDGEQPPQKPDGPIAVASYALPLAAAAVLVVIWFFAKERVLGVSTATLSLILTVIGGGLLMAEARFRSLFANALICGAFLFVIALGPLLGRDSGFILVASGPLIAATLWAWRRQLVSNPSAGWGKMMPALALVPLLAVSAYAAYLVHTLPGRDADLHDRIAAATQIGENNVRLIGFASPSSLETIGNKAAFTQLEQQALLDQISDNNWFGHGYLAPANLGNLRDFQLNDNFAAAHIHWPFGRVGLVLILTVTMMLVISTRPPPLRASASMIERWRDASATFAAWLLPGISAYMVLANLGLAPFTGRNMVLLSPGSTSDLVEAMVLLVAIGLATGGKGDGGNQ